MLVDLKLYTRHKLQQVIEAVKQLFDELQKQSERYKHIIMPGYTHLQVAMPSSFGLWLGAYAESLADDMLYLEAAWRLTNRNPLGSAAGYGSSFPLDRQMTTTLLGFDSMDYNVVYAQMGRGKMERNVAYALASVAGTVANSPSTPACSTHKTLALSSCPTSAPQAQASCRTKRTPTCSNSYVPA